MSDCGHTRREFLRALAAGAGVLTLPGGTMFLVETADLRPEPFDAKYPDLGAWEAEADDVFDASALPPIDLSAVRPIPARVSCSCGWRSGPAPIQEALDALWVHQGECRFGKLIVEVTT